MLSPTKPSSVSNTFLILTTLSDLLTCVNQLCVEEWQQLWKQCTSNKLYSAQPVVGRSVSRSQSSTFWSIAPVTVQIVRDTLEWTHSRTFLKMLHRATSSPMLKISTFTIVHNVVFTKA